MRAEQFKLGYMKTVNNVEVRKSIRMQEMPHVFAREPKCAWLELSPEERQARIDKSEARRKKQSLTMRKDQLDVERRCTPPPPPTVPGWVYQVHA